MPTIAETLKHARRQLAGEESPDADALELLSRLLGVERGEVALRGTQSLDAALLPKLGAWLGRRIAGEPVQYITGRAAFRALDLAVNPSVLIPRPETEELTEAVLQALRAAQEAWPHPRVLDLGTGSGAIALAIASEWPEAAVTATDSSADALVVARENARALGLADRVTFAEGHWFEAVDPEDRYEVIVSNPPYIATAEWDDLPRDVKLFEPRQALFSGAGGLDDLREIVDLASDFLVAGGLLALELSESRAEDVAAWFEGAHDWEEVDLRDDISGRPRILLVRRQRGPAIAPRQWKEAPSEETS
jgi:release factor glutamine methyltransferase